MVAADKPTLEDPRAPYKKFTYGGLRAQAAVGAAALKERYHFYRLSVGNRIDAEIGDKSRPDEKWDIIAEIPDLTGKVAIVTGANSPQGIGYHIAHQLAIKGARVYVGARSTEKSQNAIDGMLQSTLSLDSERLVLLAMDLNDFQQVQNTARGILEREERLDILVNNATRMSMPLHKDQHGISISFGTNFLGPYLFTTELLPLLKKTARLTPGVRIINVSSRVHLALPTGIRFNSLDDFNRDFGSEDDHQSNRLRYGLSKLAMVLFSKEIQRRANEEGIPLLAMSMHPGGVRTDGVTKYFGESNERLKDLLTPLDGALTPLFAAAHPLPFIERERYGGAYLVPFGGIGDTSQDGENERLAKDMWGTSERVLQDVLNPDP
ncbi:hypothetical protein BDV40DRAFT_295862 [Aspergillus tamarii]|uniref:Short-chain dehydrogenase n=1 Tax=Aspergillus tamarii TaxID=41984 RepID=A0A5N6V8D5_ASPTM|nr:hypothetical protein BDV40DRAFT_295862 [Aspergillus tamarii]